MYIFSCGEGERRRERVCGDGEIDKGGCPGKSFPTKKTVVEMSSATQTVFFANSVSKTKNTVFKETHNCQKFSNSLVGHVFPYM